MTRKEAIFELIKYRRMLEKDSTIDAEPFDMAIEALEKAAPIPNGNLINFGDIGSPTIKPLVKRGEWKPKTPLSKSYRFVCSVCGGTAYYCSGSCASVRNNVKNVCRYNYCPNCGARMVSE